MINLVAVYGAGWDGSALVNPLDPVEREGRDTYAAVLVDDGRVRLQVRVAWADSYLAAIRYDDRGRRVAQHEFRLSPDGDLILWTVATWDGPDGAFGVDYERRAAQKFLTYQWLDGLVFPGGRVSPSQRIGATGPARRAPATLTPVPRPYATRG